MSTVTVDGTNGPGLTLNDTVFNNVSDIGLNAAKAQLRLVQGSGNVTYIDISTAATIVVTNVPAKNYVVTIST